MTGVHGLVSVGAPTTKFNTRITGNDVQGTENLKFQLSFTSRAAFQIFENGHLLAPRVLQLSQTSFFRGSSLHRGSR